MTDYTIIRNGLTEDEQKFYQRFYPDHKVTRDLLEISERADRGNSGSMIRVIVVKGAWTPHGCARDCGAYFIKAKYDGYDRLYRFYDTDVIFKVDRDMEDK